MRSRHILLPALLLAFWGSAAYAQNLAIGKALFDFQCGSCHGQPPRLTSNASRGTNNAAMIRRAIRSKTGAMGYLSTLSDTDLADIAA